MTLHNPVSLPLTYSLGLLAYDAAWLAAAPIAALSSRVREGRDRRNVPGDWGRGPGWQDVWIQAASVGEAYLAWELLKAMPEDRRLNIILTTNTSQGLGILQQAADWAKEHRPQLLVAREYFPFDAPRLMRRALQQTLVKAVVLLETELWPGLLAACAREGVPVVVANGRMRASSLARYLALGAIFRRLAPHRILAVSEADAARYAVLFGRERVQVAPNMKLDRWARAKPLDFVDNPLSELMKPGQPFVVFGSVREPEEEQVAQALAMVLQERPKTIVGLFPRHQARVPAWEARLKTMGVEFVKRSALSEPPNQGQVVLWDVFGELTAAYALARAAFVGGSLAPLGGQNFLEPLAQGVVPVIGPSWSNFAWVGRELLDEGLVRKIQDGRELGEELVRLLKRTPSSEKIHERFLQYVAERGGGAARTVELVLGLLTAPRGN